MSKKNPTKLSQSSKAIHAGEPADPVTGEISPSIAMANSFLPQKGKEVFSANLYSIDNGFVYSRWGSPTVRALEIKIAALEEAEDALVFSSGMAAITSLFTNKLKAGDHLVLQNIGYPGVLEFAREKLLNWGIEIDFVDTSNLEDISRALRKNTKLVFIETPANPILRLADIQAVKNLINSTGIELAVDSTFASTVATKPLKLGADYVLHSLSKYYTGNGDVLGGVISGKAERMVKLRGEIIHNGAIINPFGAWLCLRSIHTLSIRMEKHQDNALKVAKFLEQHPKVARVYYPGLESHPQYDLAKRQMNNFSGMLSFRLKDGKKSVSKFIERLNLFTNAVSLGKTKSLIYYILTEEMQQNSYHLKGQDYKNYLEWTEEGIFRTSIGLEDAEDLINDLDQALSY